MSKEGLKHEFYLLAVARGKATLATDPTPGSSLAYYNGGPKRRTDRPRPRRGRRPGLPAASHRRGPGPSITQGRRRRRQLPPNLTSKSPLVNIAEVRAAPIALPSERVAAARKARRAPRAPAPCEPSTDANLTTTAAATASESTAGAEATASSGPSNRRHADDNGGGGSARKHGER
jgi:hypothetical protein